MGLTNDTISCLVFFEFQLALLAFCIGVHVMGGVGGYAGSVSHQVAKAGV